jgi:Fur family ferric uptake transcriptional regulator
MRDSLDEARGKLEAHLARHGLKHTRQREIILDAFLATQGHVTSEDLWERVRATHPEIGAATVYRTLKLFADAGIASASHFREGVTTYEHPLAHHDHLVCVACGRVVEFECSMIEDAQTRIATEYGFRLTAHRHDLFGYCPSCQDGAAPRK